MLRWRNPQTGTMEPASHSATLQALRAEQRRPTEDDAPPLSTFPGRKVKPLPGQLTLQPFTTSEAPLSAPRNRGKDSPPMGEPDSLTGTGDA